MTESPEDTVAHELTALLAEALKRLHALGDADTASTLAARAWSVLRTAHPKQAHKMDGLLHLFTGVLHRP